MAYKTMKVCIVLIVLLFFSLIITNKVLAISVTNPSPNPFNPGQGQTSTISFSVDNTQYVKVQIVNQFTSKNDASKTYSYTNVWNSPDAVTYYKEVVKATKNLCCWRTNVFCSLGWDF